MKPFVLTLAVAAITLMLMGCPCEAPAQCCPGGNCGNFAAPYHYSVPVYVQPYYVQPRYAAPGMVVEYRGPLWGLMPWNWCRR